VLGDADPQRYVEALKAAQDDPAVDAIIVILTPQAMTRPADTALAIAEQVRAAKDTDKAKPVLAAFMGGSDVMPARRELVTAGLPDYPAPERAVEALRAMNEYAEWLRRPPRAVKRFPVNRRRVERIVARHLRVGRLQMGEAKAKEILRAYDFNVSPGAVCTTEDEAVALAEQTGFPVVMKILSPDVIHKSDIGGVRLGLSSPSEVRDAFDLMMLRVKRKLPDARIEGVYLEKMASPGREVIIGMTRDPQFGPMLMFGLGGIFVEVMKDVTFHLAPITAEEAMQMLKGTRSYALLKGTRGRSGVDMQAVAECLQRISQLATDFPQIVELDINPLIVGTAGTPTVVADARITLARTEKRPIHG
jgi:acyl-CoA synthetase (NDP forming)